MRFRFVIEPRGGTGPSVREILAKASENPLVLTLEGKPGEIIVFCNSKEELDHQRQRFQETGTISSSLCTLTIDEFGVRVNQECKEESRARMKGFVQWILSEFGPCQVLDDETGEDISELASRDARVLFG